MTKYAALVALTLGLAPLLSMAQGQPAEAPPTEAVPKPASLGMFVYPGQGQDAAQQDKDEVECYRWARQQTNIDPMAAPPPAQAAEAPKGAGAKGAAKGAVKGAVIGEAIDGDASAGAGRGAAVGAVKGRVGAKKQQQQAQAQAQQQSQAQATATKDTFKKAWGACLEGRSYSVK
jgi:hypothetical protein